MGSAEIEAGDGFDASIEWVPWGAHVFSETSVDIRERVILEV